MQEMNFAQRLGWGFSEISEATGLSVNFLRNEEKRGKLKARKFGRRVLVLTEDLKAYLEKGNTREDPQQSEAA